LTQSWRTRTTTATLAMLRQYSVQQPIRRTSEVLQPLLVLSKKHYYWWPLPITLVVTSRYQQQGASTTSSIQLLFRLVAVPRLHQRQ